MNSETARAMRSLMMMSEMEIAEELWKSCDRNPEPARAVRFEIIFLFLRFISSRVFVWVN